MKSGNKSGNKYSEKLLALSEFSITTTEAGIILFGRTTAEANHFRETYSKSFGTSNFSYYEYRYNVVATYICLLAAMSDEDIEAYKKEFE